MRRILLLIAVAAMMSAMVVVAGPASATIHPIVESFDCVGTDVPEGHPIGDVADPPGQTPGYGSHSEESTLRAIEEAIDTPAFLGHKLDGKCGQVGR